jgi:hypothetical protein
MPAVRGSARRAARGLIGLGAWLVAAAPVPAGGAPGLSVTASGSLIQIRAEGATLAHVLREIGRVAGLAVLVEEGADLPGPSIAATLHVASAEEALRRLLRDRDHVLVTSPAGVLEIRIYGTAPEAARPAGAPARRGEPAPAGVTEPTPDPLQLRADALMHADPEERALALDRLVGTDAGDVARGAVLAVLDGEHDPRVLETALDLLDGLETLPLEPLLGWVARRHEPALRIRALTMLRERAENDGRVHRILSTLGQREEDETVRAAARALLGDLKAQRRDAR